MSKSEMSTQAKGRLAELQVQIQLVNRGFQVYTPLTDIGIDILVLDADLKPKFIQVKKSKYYPKPKVYWQQLFTRSFNRVLTEHTFCVFVLEDDCLIVPYNFIESKCQRCLRNGKRYLFYFRPVNGKLIERRSKVDFTQFLNNWELLQGSQMA